MTQWEAPSVAKKMGKKTFARSFFKIFWPCGRPHAQNKKSGTSRSLCCQIFSSVRRLELKKTKKTKIAETVKISVKIDKNRRFRQVLEDLGLIRIHSDVPHDFLLQIHLKSTLYDLWGLCYDKKIVQKSCPTTKTFSRFFWPHTVSCVAKKTWKMRQ